MNREQIQRAAAKIMCPEPKCNPYGDYEDHTGECVRCFEPVSKAVVDAGLYKKRLSDNAEDFDAIVVDILEERTALITENKALREAYSCQIQIMKRKDGK